VGLVGDEAQVEARFSSFGYSATLIQDWWMVCVERTVGSKIVLKASMELLRDVGHVDSRFNLF
jgi:hypothetical protein